MDGILISSLESAERNWAKWAEMRGVDPELTVKTMHGRRAIEVVALLCPDRDPEDELKIIENLEISDNEGLTVLPGVLELLRTLPLDRWTIVTSSTERLTRSRLAVAGFPMPERLVTAERVTWGKPHPEPFVAGAELLGFMPRECVVFEDAASGVEAGRAAGCTVVATTFSHAAEELDAAHYRISDLTGVKVERDGDELMLRLATLEQREIR